jgi:hypothetical protein
MKGPLGIWAALLFAAGALAAGCGDDSAAGDDATDAPPRDGEDAPEDGAGSPWFAPDPEGRTTEGNLREAEAEMIVVAPAELAGAWQAYASYRTLGGITTRVATVDEILAASSGVDDAEALRSWLRERWTAGSLRFVLLGGDAEGVPFRRVESAVTVPFTATYTANGPAELYFAELDGEWDRDGDGSWGERDQDLSLVEARATEVAVGRVPAGSTQEVADYVAKVGRYEGDPVGRATYPLLLSDVATTLVGVGDIDGAEAIELTLGQVFPEAFRINARRLYATSGAVTRYGGELLRPTKVAYALAEGYPFTFHQGHGSHWQLADQLDGDWARGLDNVQPTVFASCSCLSGNFADIADTPTYDGWVEQGPDDDSAGEHLILRPYGAAGYLGNTGVGLGPIGGSQFLHAFFQGVFEQGLNRLGEAFNWGRAHLREVRLTIMMVPFTMTDDAEWWTQMILILLGDPALALWTAEPRLLRLEAPATYGPGYQELTVRVVDAADGAPVPDATVMLVKDGDLLLRSSSGADGSAVFRFLPYGPAPLAVRASGTNLVPADATIAPTP